MRKLSIYFLALLLTGFTFTSCDDDDDPIIDTTTSVVDLAVATPNLSMLVAAVQRAGLATTLGDLTKQYTVFAPTNAAFQALLTDLGVASIEDIDVATLTSVLLFHVLDSEVKSTALSTGYVATLNADGPGDTNPSLYVDLTSGVKLNGTANVTTADVDADNGVVHIIDAVMLAPDVVDLAVSNSAFTSLVAAVTAGGLVPTLQGDGPFTIFAPTDAAFQALLDSDTTWTTLGDIPSATLDAVLKYHVVTPANVVSSTLTDGQTVTTLGGGTFTIDLDNGAQINTTSSQTVDIIITDVQGTNGIIHAIDEVLLP